MLFLLCSPKRLVLDLATLAPSLRPLTFLRIGNRLSGVYHTGIQCVGEIEECSDELPSSFSKKEEKLKQFAKAGCLGVSVS